MAVRAAGQPVAALGVVGAGDATARGRRLRAAAAANVETLVRACRPATLAPDLASTRLGFSFAARRRTQVGVVGAPSAAEERAVDRLRTWGYRAVIAAADGWRPAVPGRTLSYRPGLLPAALALAGDLGLSAAAVFVDREAPAPLTLVLR